MSHTLRKAAVVSVLVLGLILAVIVVWPRHSSPRAYCGWVPRNRFSADELRRLDDASDGKHTTYHACLLRIYSNIGIGFPDDDVVVQLPVAVTAQQIADRTGWKVAVNHCPLGEQDIEHTFGGEQTPQWTALTWNGEPAVCNVNYPGQLPDVVLVRGQTAYDLFTDSNDQLSGYL